MAQVSAGHGLAIPLFLSTGVSTSLLILWLVRYRQAWYAHQRTRVLVATRLSRVVALAAVHRLAPTFFRPEALPPGLLLALFRTSTRVSLGVPGAS